MADIGYIQIKVRELSENLTNIENRVNGLLLSIENKEHEIKGLLEKFNEDKIKEYIQKKEQLSNGLLSVIDESKHFQKEQMSIQTKKITKTLTDLNEHNLHELKYLIADFTADSALVAKALILKGIISEKEWVKIVNNEHDKCRDINLRLININPPIIKVEESV